ncbi:MAG: rRNA maturation RNase YbeY [Gloeobacteraceae cyanobacterium ES-bin-144]|nr:rRNA maturation RNase YbeY [Verrucomicrobiales bacterium]
MPITVQNRQRKIPLDLPALRKFAERALLSVLALPSEPGDALAGLEEIGVAIVSDQRIARMHLEFMNLPGPTDVLTFESGDIVISAETAAGYAVEYGQTAQDEVALYILHGLLHLRGFDDLEPAARQKMHQCQEKLFHEINI